VEAIELSLYNLKDSPYLSALSWSDYFSLTGVFFYGLAEETIGIDSA
jgi:hypothetical protein